MELSKTRGTVGLTYYDEEDRGGEKQDVGKIKNSVRPVRFEMPTVQHREMKNVSWIYECMCIKFQRQIQGGNLILSIIRLQILLTVKTLIETTLGEGLIR